jgi:RecJ-like exonuclease
MSEYDFRTCPHCAGYGVRDNGNNCTTCGGKGRGGLFTEKGVIGSGEIIIEKATGRQISHAEFVRRVKAKAESNPLEPNENGRS